MKQISSLLIFLLAFHTQLPGKDHHLEQCWIKQVKPLQKRSIVFLYREKINELYHSAEPWMQLNYTGVGTAWCNAGNFVKQDTLVNDKRVLYSKTEFNSEYLLKLDYGKKTLSEITNDIFRDQVFEIARYSPVMLIDYFFQNRVSELDESDRDFAVYRTTVNHTIVKLYINRKDNILDRATMLGADELFGDILSTFTYSDYSGNEKFYHPKTVLIEKTNGKLSDEVKILNLNFANIVPTILDKPVGYEIKKTPAMENELKVEKYNEHISFVDLTQAKSKVMLVEFSDFILAAEAPLTSANGERIIAEAKKIAPGKPVKYFTYGHFHPHYLGGVRPFVHKGATILNVQSDEEYLKYLVNAPRSLDPDSLQLQPKPLQMLSVKDSATITDGKFEMTIYFMGKKSGHTSDYLIYYFPKEKLLFEGDLVWIQKNGEVRKARGGQAGLYNFIMELKLDVKVIVQSWGIASTDYKTFIPFEDLEKSINVK